MRCIEVKLKGETRRVEFDQDIKFVDCIGWNFFCTKNFWIGLLVGICLSVLFVWNLPTYDSARYGTISKPALFDMREHGLYWCHSDKCWKKKRGTPDFPVLDIE